MTKPEGLRSSITDLAYSQMPDGQLLAAARSADGDAFAELCRRCRVRIQRKVMQMLRNREDVEDVIQESFYKAFVHLNSFRGACSFSVWLTQIAINSALMLLRKRRQRPQISYDRPTLGEDHEMSMFDFPDHAPNPEKICLKKQAIEKMLLAVGRLSPRSRDLVQHFHGTERPLRQVAEELGIKLGSAKARLVRARLKLRSTLQKQRIFYSDTCL